MISQIVLHHFHFSKTYISHFSIHYRQQKEKLLVYIISHRNKKAEH